jgi:plastocyanin
MRGPSLLLAAGCAGVLGLLQACGADDRAAPSLADLAIAKPDTGSGDGQVGVAGTRLGRDLRVVVTRGGRPVQSVPVFWSTIEGSLAPESAATDVNGISSARWTLQHQFAQQVASARVDQGGPPAVLFTAIATPDPAAPNTVLVGVGGSRFEPAELTIAVGDSANWLWPAGSSGHNVVPDDGDSPPQSGPLVGYPKYHSFRFEIPGVYHYHCMAHGGVGGVGMSGTITVLPEPVR